jgi:hypothetical protein
MKKLLIILLLIPSIAFAKTKNKPLDLDALVKERCKNWATLEDRPQKEVTRCLAALIARNSDTIRDHDVDITNIFDFIDDYE